MRIVALVEHGEEKVFWTSEIAEYELHSWACRQNVEKGLAPSVGALIRQRDGKGEEAKGVLSSEPRRSRSRWASYKWISRWRKKWRMPKAKIQDRDSPTPSEMREKVWPRQCPSWQRCISRFGPTLFLGEIKSAKCESCLQERVPWLIGKRPHFGSQILTKRGSEKRNRFGGRHDWCKTELGVQKRPPFFSKSMCT